MKLNYLKELSPRACRLIAGFLFLAPLFVVHSCRKDNSKNDTPADPALTRARAWYEENYPPGATARSRVLSPNASSSAKGAALFNYSKYIKPYWQHAASYKRFNADVLELPIDPTSTPIGTALSNTPNGPAVYKKQYSRSSFLILNDSAGYHAYIMTLIADSAYINNDLRKLERNKYNKRDTDYSGTVLYHTPEGVYVNGWLYNKGQIVMALPPAQNGTLHAGATALTRASGAVTKTGTLGKNTRELEITTCYDWYQTVSFTYTDSNGNSVTTTTEPVLIDEQCNTTYVSTTGSGSGSNSATGSSGGSGSSSSATPPPPCQVPSSAAEAAVLPGKGGLTRVVQSNAGGTGFPAPTTTTTNPCPEVVVQPIVDTTKSPCAKISSINATAKNSTIANQNQQLTSYLATSSLEHGFDQNLQNWTAGVTSNYQSTSVLTASAATPNQLNPPFFWDSVNGYTIGFTHNHPNGSGPSPEDIFLMLLNSKNSSLTAAGAAAVTFYQANASVTVVTKTNNYVVTVSNSDSEINKRPF